MNILIPMAGAGSRFEQAGYTFPKPLIEILEQHKIDSIPLYMRHARTLGGGFHCVTLDLKRT